MPLTPVRYPPSLASLVEANVRPAAPAGAAVVGVAMTGVSVITGVAAAAEHALATKAAPTTRPAIEVHRELGCMSFLLDPLPVDPASNGLFVSKGCVGGTGRPRPPVHHRHRGCALRACRHGAGEMASNDLGIA